MPPGYSLEDKKLRSRLGVGVSSDGDTGVPEGRQNYFDLRGRQRCHSSTIGAATKTDE